MNRPTVSAIIINFNGEHYLPGMMAALQAEGWPFLEVIVADDASTDAGLLLLRHRYPQLRVLPSDKNRGPGDARNRAIAAAQGELTLLLDNDCYPQPGAVEAMVSAMEQQPEVQAVMPRIILRGPPTTVHCDGSRTHITGQMSLVNGHRGLHEVNIESVSITGLMGSAMMFRRTAALRVGGFQVPYFIYYEDHDFGTRIALSGGSLRTVPTAVFDHLFGTANLSFRTGRAYPARHAYFTIRNRWRFMLTTLRGRTLIALLPVLFIHELAQLAFALKKGWGEHWFSGLRWNLTHLAATLRTREIVQATRKLEDSALLEAGPSPIHPGLFAKKPAAQRWKLRLDWVENAIYGTVRRWIR